MARDYRLQVRLTDEETEIVRKAAELAGLTMSEFARSLVVAGAVGILKGDEEYFKSLVNSTAQLLHSRAVGRQYLPGMSLQGGEMDNKSGLNE